MKELILTHSQLRRANTDLVLAESELEAASLLIDNEQYRESIFHLYFSCFYISISLLSDVLGNNPSHQNVNTQLHKKYGRCKDFPRRYIELHVKTHEERNNFNYNTSINPSKMLIIRQYNSTVSYWDFARKCIPKISYKDTLQELIEKNPNIITEYSFDYYCPKTYANHTRFSIWIPPFYNDVFSLNALSLRLNEAITKLKIRNHDNYVLGLNSRINQYYEGQLLLLDFDSYDSDVESELKKLNGILYKTGRGYHFIGNKVIEKQADWIKIMKRLPRLKSLKGRIDENHINISLLRGYSTIRITSSQIKPEEPMFYKELW